MSAEEFPSPIEELLEQLSAQERVIAKLKNMNDDLRAKLAEAQKDAERYRWLREADKETYPGQVSVNFNVGHDWQRAYDMDATIDAAIAQKREPK